MRIKELLHLFIKYLHAIPGDMPLHTEEMLLWYERKKCRLNSKNRKLPLEKKK